MNHYRTAFIFIILALFIFFTGHGLCLEAPVTAAGEKKPKISITKDMGKAAMREAAKVKKELEQQARSLFDRKPLGWNLETLQSLYEGSISLPLKVPELTRRVIEQNRALGFIGSILVFLFILVVIFSLLGRKRILSRFEQKVQPLAERIPEGFYPHFQSFLKVVVSALIPFILLGLFALVNALISYRAAWFQLAGRVIGIWAVGTLLIRLLREMLTRNYLKVMAESGPTLFRYARLILFYVMIGIVLYWTAEAYQVRSDVLAMFRFVLSASIVIVLFLLLLRKGIILSLLPELPYRSYRWFRNFMNNYYYPLLTISFLAALFWCFGYASLGRLVLIKIWFTVGASLAIVLIYHGISDRLKAWARRIDRDDEAAQLLVRSLRSLLLYATVIVAVIVIFNLLGLLSPLERVMSFPMFQLGDTQLTLWIILKALLILMAFIFASRFLRAYLDYKVYPKLGVDPGLGYALNTFFRYVSLALGFLISIKLVGINLQFLLVFAGAAGIGIGLGLQSMAANIISGFSIIFGGKIRKGDWIEVGGTMGKVTDIYLRATKVRSRDNIEFLIPNSNLISDIIVNYSLSSPMIRIALSVGVGYNADPREVERILLDVAENEPLVSTHTKPGVRFIEYGDSAINFELLIWIDARSVARRKVRSALYFSIFEQFKKADIEIPFPQRDLHIRSKIE